MLFYLLIFIGIFSPSFSAPKIVLVDHSCFSILEHWQKSDFPPKLLYAPFKEDVLPTANQEGLLHVKNDVLAEHIRDMNKSVFQRKRATHLFFNYENGIYFLSFPQIRFPFSVDNIALDSFGRPFFSFCPNKVVASRAECQLHGRYNFIVDLNGNTFLSRQNCPNGNQICHPCIVGGYSWQINVRAAGEIYFEYGILTRANLNSGHFRPPSEFSDYYPKFFSWVPKHLWKNETPLFEKARNWPYPDWKNIVE